MQESNKEKDKLDISLAVSTKLKKIKSDIIEIQQSLLYKHRDEKVINAQAATFKEKQIQLDLHHKLSHVQGPLATYNDALSNAEKSQENLKEYQLRIEEAQTHHAQTIVEMASLTKKEVHEGNFKKIMNDFETEINNADRDLKNLIDNGRKARERINKSIGNYPLPLSESIKPYEALSLLESRGKKIQLILSEAQLDTTITKTTFRKQLKLKQEELESLKEIQTNYKQTGEIQSSLIKLKKELEGLIKVEKIKSPLVQKYIELAEAGEQKIKLLNKQKEDAIKIAELEDFRNALVSNKPCPLCGSLAHPYADHKPELHRNEIDDKIQLAQKELKQKQKELDSFRKELTQCITSIEFNQKLITTSTLQLSNAEKELEETITKFRGESSYAKNDIVKSIELLSKQNKTTEVAIEAMEELIVNKDLIQQYRQLQQNIQDYKHIKQSRDSKFAGADVNIITNKLQEVFEANKSKITELTAVIRKEIDSLKKASNLVNSIADKLKSKIVALGFSDIKEISNHLLNEATVNDITSKRDLIIKEQTSIETQIKTLNKELEKKLREDSKPDLLLDSVIESIQEQENLIDKHQHRVITNQGLIKRDDEDLNRIKSKEKVISKLNKEIEKWSLLNKMIGDATGNKFANFAQGLTLQNLLVYANRRLQNLSDRYLLDKPENDGALIVIDKYQGNTRRSVRTLSGGESFLISLALALSLSDMASKNVALECLFIDEGFGTLDSESLESALNTLEKLQSESQKTVGVISHVEALKERIDVQLKLNKNAQGYSQIEVVSQNGN